ncbi:hypothetical protein T266_32925 [Pseudomonas aeruginosa VRFPA05]|nr:hypothetical protein T266_32925 [Pseudomonas aeruginosa VRFPA05]
MSPRYGVDLFNRFIEVSHEPALIIRKVYPEWQTCIRRILKLIVERITEPMKNH